MPDASFLSSDLFLLTLTVGLYCLGGMIYRRTRLPLLHPVLLTFVAVIVFLRCAGIGYERYRDATGILNFALGMSVVALGYLLYEQLERLRGSLLPVGMATLAGCVVGVLSVVYIAMAFGAERQILNSIAPKSVTVPIAVSVAGPLGGLDENPYFPLVAARAKEENAQAIPICAKTEEDIAGSTQEEKIAFLQEMGIESTGLDKLIKASYELLGLISFLTDGKKECRAWTIRKGTKAPQAAGKIHSDFERGFIRAQVIAYKDLEDADFNYAAVKAKGLQRTEGKEYVVNDGDVIEFLFNV